MLTVCLLVYTKLSWAFKKSLVCLVRITSKIFWENLSIYFIERFATSIDTWLSQVPWFVYYTYNSRTLYEWFVYYTNIIRIIYEPCCLGCCTFTFSVILIILVRKFVVENIPNNNSAANDIHRVLGAANDIQHVIEDSRNFGGIGVLLWDLHTSPVKNGKNVTETCYYWISGDIPYYFFSPSWTFWSI